MMFTYCNSLEDASGINGWDIKFTANFQYMFMNVTLHPKFVKFPNGTWTSGGTFKPNA